MPDSFPVPLIVRGAVVYDLSDSGKGVQDCPRCRHTMQRLRSRLSIRQNAGYMADDGNDGTFTAFFLFGWLGYILKTFYHYTFQPVVSKLFGEMKERKLERILHESPNSLICPYCNYVLKRK